MLNPQHTRYANHLRSLIEEGKQIAKLEHQISGGLAYIGGQDQLRLQAWFAQASNALHAFMGSGSPHIQLFEKLIPERGPRQLGHAIEVYQLTGVLSGALDDLEHGFLLGQELLLAEEIFDSVLSQAAELNRMGYKDPAAMLGRVVVEDALKRLAHSYDIDSDRKASVINTELRTAGLYPLNQERLIQSWLDIGNDAAHGHFDRYDQQKVASMLNGITQFLAVTF